MTKCKKILLLILVGIIVIGLDSVYAANGTLSNVGNIICDNGNFYNFSGTIGASEFYNKMKGNGFGLIVDGNEHTYSTKTSNFKYSLKNSETKCYYVIEGTEDDFKWNFYSCNQKYGDNQITIDNSGTKNEQIFDKNTGTITIKLTVSGDLASQFDRIVVDAKYNGSVGTISKDSENKKIIISGISPAKSASETMYIVMYLANPNANDFYKNGINAVNNCSTNGKLLVTTTKAFIYPASFFDVETGNTFVDSVTCKTIREFSNATEEFKRQYVSECYTSKKVSYDEYLKMGSTISNKLTVLKSMFKDLDENDLIDQKNLKCTNSDLGLKYMNVDGMNIETKQPYSTGTGKVFERKRTYENCGTYWCAACYEEYYIEADDPQLVYAGEGVEYNNKVEIRSYCTITNIKEVEKPQQCVQTCSPGLCAAHGFWGTTGGPNADFDSCVKKCDGGEYTQECINKCYDKVYNGFENDATSSQLNSNRNIKNLTIATKIENEGGYMDPNSEVANFVSSTDNGTTVALFQDYSDGDHKVTIGNTTFNMNVKSSTDLITGINVTYINPVTGEVSNLQNQTMDFRNNPGKIITFTNESTGEKSTVYEDARCFDDEYFGCQVTCTTGPAGCSWNPEAEYQAGLTASRNEYNNYYIKFTDTEKMSPINSYTIRFEDTETGKKYEISGSTSNPPSGVALDIEQILGNVSKGQNVRVRIGNQGDYNEGPLTFNNIVIYEVKLPKQYTLKDDANTIIVKGKDGYYKKVADRDDNYHFQRVSDLNEKLLTGGKNVYYTDLSAKDSNVDLICESTKVKKFIDSGSSGSKMSDIVETTKIKNGIPVNSTRQTLLEIWSNPENIDKLTEYSYKAYTGYIVNGNFRLKTLEEHYDNIKVEFQIGTLGDQAFTNSEYKCYYGVYNMIKNTDDGSCNGDNPPPSPTPTPTGTIIKGGLRYYYHEINLEKIFDKREPRWNWTGTIKGNEVTGAASNTKGYIVDPERLITSIENKGNTIYTNESVQEQEMDYEYTLTNNIIQEIRNYNKTRVNGSKIPYTEFTLAVANNKQGDNFSEKVAEWLGTTVKAREIQLSSCNNSLAGDCYNYNLGGK